MDKLNLKEVQALAEADSEREKVEMVMESVFPGEHLDVPDPYWNDDGFAGVYNMLDKACEAIIEKHTNENNIEI